ncbi:ADP-dependent (S)-NAD(P)H-hydrate dehydratase [uncultured archaeon]|nr:ADP-dependent (S)-NAD(P)H-hydrate dehydratase [uncultured archaeon]
MGNRANLKHIEGKDMNRFYLKKYLPEYLTSEDMAAIDENATTLGIPRLVLMENAGTGTARITKEIHKVDGEKIVIIAGTGNNGGDGCVAARHLLNLGASVCVILLGQPDDIRTHEAKMNWNILSALDIGIKVVTTKNPSELEQMKNEIKSSDIIIDAILGTGIKGSIREPIATAIQLMNESGKPVIAIDTPTGLDPTTGEVKGTAIKAELTVTFHRMKRGLIDREEYTGKIYVCDIGIPVEAELFTGPGDVRRIVKPRNQYSYKGDYGYVLIIGGSNVYSGAPALAAMASLRTGAGLAIAGVPESVSSVVKSYSPDIIVHPLEGDTLSKSNIPYIQKLLEKVDALVIGPGLGLAPETFDFVKEVLRSSKLKKLPALIDADAIKALKDSLEILRDGNFLLTPHAGEFEIISGVRVSNNWKERVGTCVEFAKENRCTLLLKGHETVITDGKRLKVNRTGNPAMATGGTGDVLSGIAGACLAQGTDTFNAASAGAFIHGKAGNLAYEEKGFHIVASDLLDKIPVILKHFDVNVK